MPATKKTAKIMDGKKIADDMLFALAKEVQAMEKRPGLAAILVGADSASRLYVNSKKKACQKVGIEFHEYLYGAPLYPEVKQEGLIEMIDWLNKDKDINGIILQLPLPKEYNTNEAIEKISVDKDVDVFHPENQGKFLTDKNKLVPPLIQAILISLENAKQNLEGKTAVIVVKNPIFSQALDGALKQQKIVAKNVKPDDKNLEKELKNADIVITVVGKKHYLKPEMIKPDAIVIDVGTTLSKENKLFGDADPKVAKVASFFTPVPGGVGPLTVAALLNNVYRLAIKK